MEPEQLQHITWHQLYRKPNTLRLPFHLTLADGQGSIFCETLLRLLPRKRLVFKGRWQGQPVVVKLFIEPGRAATHFARELAGIQTLIESGTPTPRLLHHGHTQRYRIPMLVTEYLTKATNLATLWEAADDKNTLTPLMESVTLELATQHVQGILQHDLHFGNLLIRHPSIYSLDGDSIEFFPTPLPHKQSLAHLALFFSQLGAGTRPLQEHLLQIYADARGWRLKPFELRTLKRLTRDTSRLRLARYKKKVLRRGTQTRMIRQLGTRIWYHAEHESPALLQFFRDPDAIFQRKETVILKNGRSATLARIAIGDKVYVIKRYNIKGIGHWLRRCLRPTRARHCWQKAHCLTLAGVATAAPVACIEKHVLGLRGRSYYLMDCVSGQNLLDALSQGVANDPAVTTLARRVSHLLNQLKELGLSHGDLKATNFLVTEDNKPVLIDLDGMKRHAAPQKEWPRFLDNWKTRPDIEKMFQSLLGTS